MPQICKRPFIGRRMGEGRPAVKGLPHCSVVSDALPGVEQV
jgi:hypothetical protein